MLFVHNVLQVDEQEHPNDHDALDSINNATIRENFTYLFYLEHALCRSEEKLTERSDHSDKDSDYEQMNFDWRSIKLIAQDFILFLFKKRA